MEVLISTSISSGHLLDTPEDLALLVGADMPAKSCARFVRLPAVITHERLLSRVAHHVRHEVVLRAACMATQCTLEWLDALVDPNVLLKVRTAPHEGLGAVWAFVGAAT